MKNTLSKLFCAALLSAVLPFSTAAAPVKTPRDSENRFLFVLDISSAMRGYSNAVAQGVMELLSSEMKGELRPGDTIGLWTYNDQLYTEYPMQVWSDSARPKLMSEMDSFLRDLPYQKHGRLDKVLPGLNQVVKNSERVTIILMFDGSGTIKGTPFDKEIGVLQKKYAKELRTAHVPFVLVLAARHGAVFDYTINYPGLVAIPHTAWPDLPVETNAVVAAVPVVKTNPAVVIAIRPQVQPHSFIMSAPTPVRAVPAPAPIPVNAITLSNSAPVAAVSTNAPAVMPSNPIVANPVNSTVEKAWPQAISPAPVEETVATAPARSASAPVTQPVVYATPANQVPLFIIAFSLLTMAIALVVFLVYRARHLQRSSLITKSIERSR